MIFAAAFIVPDMRLLFQGLYFVVHLSVLGLFVLGLSARYVHPAIAWWLQPLAIGLPVIAAMIVVLTVTAGAMQRWTLFALSLAAILLFALRYVSALTSDEPVNADVLTVVTTNSGGGTSASADARGIRPLIEEVEPDVLCLQEFTVDRLRGEPRARYNLQPLIDSLDYVITAPQPSRGHRNPPPVISRLPLQEASVRGLSTRRDSDPAGTVVRAQYGWGDRAFVVYNVHLQSFATWRPWTEGETFNPRAWIRFIRWTSTAFLQRALEADEIRGMIDRETLPVLLCGDFNSTPHQWTYRRLSEDLRDAFRTAGGFWGPTFPARFPLFRIDYVLTSEDWAVERVSVGPELAPDHRPVIARLKLKPDE